MKLYEKEIHKMKKKGKVVIHNTAQKGKGGNVNLKSALYIKKSHYLFTCIWTETINGL